MLEKAQSGQELIQLVRAEVKSGAINSKQLSGKRKSPDDALLKQIEDIFKNQTSENKLEHKEVENLLLRFINIARKADIKTIPSNALIEIFNILSSELKDNPSSNAKCIKIIVS